MDLIKDAAIRARAYQLWIESGYADGQQEKHWRQAEREIAAREPAGDPDPGHAHGPADAAARPAESWQHSDGTSRHPSVLDPGSGR